MSEVRAVARYLRIAPRKMRVVINSIRNLSVSAAMVQLTYTQQKAARFAKKVLSSAVASAKARKLDTDRLVVTRVFADGGPSLKRFRARSMGRGNRILKRTCHLTLVLGQGRGQKTAQGPKIAMSAKAAEKPKQSSKQKKTVTAKG